MKRASTQIKDFIPFLLGAFFLLLYLQSSSGFVSPYEKPRHAGPP
jgi:hypothetical protein